MYEKLVADVRFLRGDYETAAEMYREGATDGDMGAACNYAWCLWRGIGVAQNAKEAKSFFVFARDLDGGEACYNLAVMYMHGDGVRRDYRTAFEYMQSAAIKGCIEAQLYLGMAYTLGAMFEPDIIGISMIPYHKPEYRNDFTLLAGDVPDAEEDERLRCVVPEEPRLAFKWFGMAATHSPDYVEDLCAKGQFLFAKCYIDGHGTEVDVRRGNSIMLLAGDNGSEDAKTYIAENAVVRPRLTSRGTFGKRRPK